MSSEKLQRQGVSWKTKTLRETSKIHQGIRREAKTKPRWICDTVSLLYSSRENCETKIRRSIKDQSSDVLTITLTANVIPSENPCGMVDVERESYPIHKRSRKKAPVVPILLSSFLFRVAGLPPSFSTPPTPKSFLFRVVRRVFAVYVSDNNPRF